ncbi:MAG: hypothetical protein ACREP5_13800 [Candidatus Binatia bacterium]
MQFHKPIDVCGKPIYTILHHGESFVHVLTKIAQSNIKNIYFPIDLLKPTINLLETSVNLLEMSVNLLEMSVDFLETSVDSLKSPVNLLESTLGLLKP